MGECVAAAQPPSSETAERYGYSVEMLRRLGRAALLPEGAPERQGIEQEAWLNFVTSLQENLATDADFGERASFEPPMRAFEIRGGQVTDATGRPMTDIVAAGVDAIRREAADDECLQGEVERAENDLRVAREVDTLQPGELLAVVSMDPKEDLARYPAAWQKRGNYRLGKAVIQVYYRAGEHTMLASAYSVQASSKDTFARLLAGHGVNVPPETPSNQWILHGIRVRADEATARTAGQRLREEYYALAGRTAGDISVTRLVTEHEALLRNCFDTYVRPLARAVNTGYNQPVLQYFAYTLLELDAAANTLDAATRTGLQRVANNARCTAEDARLLEGVIRYALVEELRGALTAAVSRPAQSGQPVQSAYPGGMHMNVNQLYELHQRFAANVQKGYEAGRSYGGCSAVGPGNGSPPRGNDTAGQQAEYGGRAAPENAGGNESGACRYTHNGCYCSPYDDDGAPLPEPMEVVAERAGNGYASCLRPGCGACLGPDGTVRSYGRIYEKAMARQQAATTANND